MSKQISQKDLMYTTDNFKAQQSSKTDNFKEETSEEISPKDLMYTTDNFKNNQKS